MKCSTKTTRPISSILPSSREPSVSPARPTPKEFAPPLPLSSKLPCRRSSERLPSIEQLNRSFGGLSATRRLPSRHVPHLQDHISIMRAAQVGLFFCSGMMLAPVGSIASTMKRDLRQEEFGGEPALSEVRSDSLLGPFRWNLRIEEHQHRRARSAKRGPEDAGISSKFLERGKQRREGRPIRLMNAVFECRGEQVRTILRKRREQQH